MNLGLYFNRNYLIWIVILYINDWMIMSKKIKYLFMWLISLFLFNFTFASNYVFYYGQWCPHCAKVEEYMESVDWYSKLNITKKEVYFDKNNAQELNSFAQKLWINSSEVWVPFLLVQDWDKYSYLIWDKPIIDHFKTALGNPEPKSNNNIILIVIWVIVLGAVVSMLVFKPKKA